MVDRNMLKSSSSVWSHGLFLLFIVFIAGSQPHTDMYRKEGVLQ
jgi:hypothetical protein